MKVLLAVVFYFSFSDVFGITYLPSYIRTCFEKDPNFDKCAIENAKYAIPFIAKGDKQFKIPSLMPMVVPLVEINTGNNFKLKMKNMRIYGMEKLVPLSFHTDFDKKHSQLVLAGDQTTLKGEYEIDGKILVFPLKGSGNATVDIYGGVYDYTFDWIIEKKNGVDFARPINTKLDFKVKKVTYNFENLFNGDEQLGKETNRLLNENWESVNKDVQPHVSRTILQICDNIAKQFYTKIPYKELFKQ